MTRSCSICGGEEGAVVARKIRHGRIVQRRRRLTRMLADTLVCRECNRRFERVKPKEFGERLKGKEFF